MKARLGYTLLGFGIGAVASMLLSAVLGKHIGWPNLMITFNSGILSVAIAERRGKVKSMKEIQRPLTLFPPGPPRKS